MRLSFDSLRMFMADHGLAPGAPGAEHDGAGWRGRWSAHRADASVMGERRARAAETTVSNRAWKNRRCFGS